MVPISDTGGILHTSSLICLFQSLAENPVLSSPTLKQTSLVGSTARLFVSTYVLVSTCLFVSTCIFVSTCLFVSTCVSAYSHL